MSIKKDIFAPLASGLGATRRAALLLLVMMLTATTAWATTTSTINVGGTDYTLFTGFTATAGTTVAAAAFNYSNMVDGDLSSSWHLNDEAQPYYVEFNSDDPIIPKGYIFNTFNASSFKPTDWVLKAKADAGDSWTTLSSKSGQSLAYGQEFQYACDNSGNNAYKYFRFEVSNSNNNIWLTEIRLYGNMSYTHISVKAATCTETGIKQECWRRTDGKYFTDETGTTELAESDVIAPMKPHTAEHHAATSTNIEYWTCSVCGKYFSDEACTTEITEAETQTTVFGTLANGCYTLTSQTYTLTDDINTAGYIYVPEGVTATIDLAGHTIDRGLTSAVENGYVIKVAGTLTLTDSGTGGTVRGGMGSSTNKTSCVYVPDGGTFTLAGGTLIGNTSDEGNRAVYVAFSAHFIMTGGKITGDVCGIDASGHLTISGGEISGNSQRGIYPGNYSISISGNPRITDNGNVNVNLYDYDAARLTVTGALTEGASIGITPHGTPTANAPVTVTSGYGTYNTASPDTYFMLDNNSFVLGWNEDRTEVAVGTELYTVGFDMNGHGSAIDAVSVLSGCKVLEPTAPTADGWYFVGWFTDADCTAGNEYDFDDAVTSNMTLHALWTQEAIYSFTLPEKMVIVSTTNAPVGGKYPVGTVIKFKVSSADYVVDGDVSDGTNTLTPDGDGIYTVTMGDADITITATIKKAVEPNKTLSGSENYEAQDGDVLTGSTSGTLTIPDGAKVTLSDVTISGGIVCAGTAEITLVGTNSVSNTWYSSAGIQIGGSSTTLTIKGDGSLNATGGSQAAGIGLGRTFDANSTGGRVIIEGGTVTASGGNGIGTGTVGNNMTATIGDIIIKGGTVNARLGKGYIYNGSTATIGTIKIYDGIEKVDASAITESVTYMHVDGNTETDVTASASTYFTIIEDGDRRIITPKDNTDYTITIAGNTEHGTIACAATTAKYGDKITITATPDFGYRLSRLVVKDAQNKSVASMGNSFTMPQSNVTVSAVFEQGTHGTTEFKWTYDTGEGPGSEVEETIYDGVTTVNLQTSRSYNIIKNYDELLIDNDEYQVSIPYSGGTGSFVQNGTSFNNNGDAGFYDITMTDAGNGKWNVSILKTAGQMDVVPDQTYTGSEITPEPLVMAGSLNLIQGTDYVYSYENNENVGTAKVIATFQGDYASLGSVEKEFTIVPKSVTNNDISITIPSQEWTGNELTPVITVTDGETELTLNTDYTVTPPSGPVQNASDYTYTITGMGNYAGSREATFTISLTPDPADISVNAAGTEYTIHTVGGWNAFCDLLAANTKGYFSGKTVKLDADIAVSRMAGGHEFTGTFDGGGHTLTLAYGTADAPVDAQFIAPFVETAADDSNQPVFRNLTIDGTIYASNPQAADHYHVGGLIGHLFGDVTIEHCNSLVHITAPGGAGGFVGLCEHTAMFTDCLSSAVITSPGGNNSGFVGWSRASGHAISFDGCTFNGKLLQQDGNGSHNGGFIGWTGANKTVTFTNCLCAPATLASGETMASGNSATFARGWNATTTATNSYYTQTFGDAQGTKPIVTASKPSNIGDVGTAYNVSGITAYGNGLLYGSDYYCVNSQFGEIALAYSGSSLTATIDGTSVATVSIPEDVTVSSVTYNRAFTMGRPSTVMLPFSKDVHEISGGTFYTFGGVEKKNNKWEATMNEVMGSLTANTPYLFVPTGTSLTFTGGATLNTTGGGNCLASDTGGWEFHGTYTNKVWDEVVTHDYGFAALSGTSADDKSVEAGQFVRLTTGASAKPMRCYLSYVGGPAQARAMTRGAAATDEELPQSIIVRLVGSNGQTTAIGTIDTKTGEMTFFDEQSGKAERDSEAWYTLDGVRLSGKPTKKGLYINNGKKIVIK